MNTDPWQGENGSKSETVARLYDKRFCRMWEIYLAGSEMAFRNWNQMVFQMQLAKRIDTVPLTRDYTEERKRAREASAVPD